MGSLIYIAIVVGIVTGLLGGLIMKSKSYGILINIATGIAGAVLGIWAIGQLSYTFEEDKYTASIICSVILSIIIVWLVALLRRKG